MSVLGQLAGKAQWCACKCPAEHVARRGGTVRFRPLGSHVATRSANALYKQRSQIPWQLRRSSQTQTSKRSQTKGVQAAQQHFSNRLSGTGARGALPSMQVKCTGLSRTSI